ncbi:hypothetical protein NIES39_J01240 [Arthrospira platensis NIES-39]|nr:hypothetical protein NIES39_J01240 [Arthrospira platensis NIES-39]
MALASNTLSYGRIAGNKTKKAEGVIAILGNTTRLCEWLLAIRGRIVVRLF